MSSRSRCRSAPMPRRDGQACFIAELVYCGIFTINVPQDQLEPVLLVECPRLLFPFARNILADVTRDGGFPPVHAGADRLRRALAVPPRRAGRPGRQRLIARLQSG